MGLKGLSSLFLLSIASVVSAEDASHALETPLLDTSILLLHVMEISLAAFSMYFCYKVIKATGLMGVFRYFLLGLLVIVLTSVVSFSGHVIVGLHEIFSTHLGEVVRIIGQVIALICVTFSFYRWHQLLKS